MLPKVRTSGPGPPCSGDCHEEALGYCRVIAGEHSGAGPIHLRIWRAHHPRRSRPRDGADSRRLRQHQEGEALEERGQRPPGQSEIAAGQDRSPGAAGTSRRAAGPEQAPAAAPAPAPPLPFRHRYQRLRPSLRPQRLPWRQPILQPHRRRALRLFSRQPRPPHLPRRRPLPRFRPHLLSFRSQPRRRLFRWRTHRLACG